MWRTPIWKIYLLECSDKTFYCGITIDLDLRLKMHNAGKASKYTSSRTPVKLLWSKVCKSESDARRKEIAIKKLTKEKKRILIEGEGK
jgi:putative endonuclease